MRSLGGVDTLRPCGHSGVGNLVKQALEAEGLVVEWNGDPEKRINVNLDWKRRRR